MKVEDKEVVTIEETVKKEERGTTEETVVRLSNVRRPRRASSLKMMTDSKQSLVGDYSCCSQIP